MFFFLSCSLIAQPNSVVFQIPIHTTKANVPTTCVEVTFTVSDSRDDIFSRICAYMDIPRDYKKLGWRLNSARRSDPPRRFLTSEDVDSAFKEASEARGSGRRKKRVVIEIINTVGRMMFVFFILLTTLSRNWP